jgi:hypothetical protein
VGDPVRDAEEALVSALLRLTRAQIDRQNRPDVTALLLRAGAAVADAMDLVAQAKAQSTRMAIEESPRVA